MADVDQPIKRAPVVYGRRSNRLSPPPAAVPADQRPPSESHRVHHALAEPQRHQSSPSPSVCASDDERSRSPDTADPFQFGFRHRLKELDQEFDHRDTQPLIPGPSLSSEAVRAGPSQGKDLQSVPMDTTVLSPDAHPFSANISPPSFPPSPAAFRVTSQESPPVRRRGQRASNALPPGSETEAHSRSSSASPVRHAITTPHSRSSPTPPTSGEVSMVSRTLKGKAPVRDVLPLAFDDERPSATEFPTKPKKGRRNGPSARPKTKAPTKKERREAAFESSRIAANRPVEVIRTQEHKHSLSAFFAGLRRDNIITPTSGAELPSDPIEKFSSPTEHSMRVPLPNSVFGAPTRLLRNARTSDRPSSEKTRVLPPAAGDSDEEMSSVTSIIRASGKYQKLQAMKLVALQHADTSEAFDNDEDDDLLVVKDDMHTVAREEAAQRRLDKAHGSPVKVLATLRRINHPSARPALVSPSKLSKRMLEELAKPSFARKGKGSKAQLTKKQLDQLMIGQHTEEQLKSIKRHEEEWIKGGGKLSRGAGDGPQTSLSQQLGTYAELGLKAAETDSAVEDEASVDESDEDYNPNLRGSASPEPMDAGEDDGEPGNNMEVQELQQPQVEEEEEVVAPFRRKKSGHRHPRIVIGSDDEGEQLVDQRLPGGQRDIASSMEPQTEDENDKENSAKLMYDRSEDKENKAVVRHELLSSETTLGLRPVTLHGGVQGSLSLASAKDLNDTTTSPKDVRAPLKDISKDEDDFLSSRSASSLFADGLQRMATGSPPNLNPSPSTLSLGSPPVLRSERISRINRLSLDSENDENGPSGFKPLQPSFLERLRSQVGPEPSLALINPLPNGGFSQLFSAEDQSLTRSVDKTTDDELSLTLDVGLKPALEVSGTLMRKAETIFEKEQEYVVTAAVQTNRPRELLYVNDHGFLTQTRPEGSSPEVYRMTPSQVPKSVGTQVHSTQAQLSNVRAPLRTLSFTTAQELSSELQPPKRLHRRSHSPLEQKFLGQNSNLATKNAFDILGKVLKPSSKAQKEKLEKSEFVAVEAEESDEDDMFGFGGPKKDDEEEEDADQDKIVEGLVDDTVMDVETQAVDLVLEKHREHEEEADQQLQKLHQDAIDGKFRVKRRDRGVGFEDESDDDDDDDDARRIRQRLHKKRKIEGDSLEALGQNEDTRPFYNAYQQDLIDEDDEFGHLRGDAVIPTDDDDTQATQPEDGEIVSVDEIRQRVREAAQNDLEFEVLDPEDTSWIDHSMMNEVDDAVRIKVVEYRRNKSTARRLNTGQMDFDTERPTRYEEDEQERNQLTSWAKNQNHRYQGTGRSGNGAAITGHSKVKNGGGSMRSTQSSSVTTVTEARKTKKTSSLLSTVSNRRDRFA